MSYKLFLVTAKIHLHSPIARREKKTYRKTKQTNKQTDNQTNRTLFEYNFRSDWKYSNLIRDQKKSLKSFNCLVNKKLKHFCHPSQTW